jgi:hypothetical protein
LKSSDTVAKSTLLAIMDQIETNIGQEIAWDMACNSKEKSALQSMNGNLSLRY